MYAQDRKHARQNGGRLSRTSVCLRAYSEYAEQELDEDFMSSIRETSAKVIGWYSVQRLLLLHHFDQRNARVMIRCSSVCVILTSEMHMHLYVAALVASV